MARDKYQLRPNEGILLKASCVRHGFWGAYTNELVLTNEAILLVEFGMFSNYKGTIRYQLSDLKVVNGKPQVIIGSASNGEKQLEVYFKDGSKEDFAFQSDSLRQLKVWEMAISDRFLPNSQDYDAGFYSNLSNSAIGGLSPEDIQEEMLIAKMEGFEKAYNESTTNTVNAEFLGDVAKNMLKSGNFTAKGVLKSVNKAAKKQQRNALKDSIFGEIDDEIQDEFTAIGNEFREAFGFKPKELNCERKEKYANQVAVQRQAAFDQQIQQARQEIESRRMPQNTGNSVNNSNNGVDPQIENLMKLKDLLDAGLITKEEFEQKKKAVLSIDSVKKCPNCGAEVGANSKFCGSCGTKIEY